MNQTILMIGLVLIIVFVGLDLMLFAFWIGVFLVLLAAISFFGKIGHSVKSPMGALEEDIRAEMQDIENAKGNHPSGAQVAGIYGGLVQFLVGDRRKKKGRGGGTETKAGSSGGHGGAHEAQGGGGHDAHGAGHGEEQGGGHGDAQGEAHH